MSFGLGRASCRFRRPLRNVTGSSLVSRLFTLDNPPGVSQPQSSEPIPIVLRSLGSEPGPIPELEWSSPLKRVLIGDGY